MHSIQILVVRASCLILTNRTLVTNPLTPDPLSHWGEGCRRRGEGVASIEEKHKNCHCNLQTSNTTHRRPA